MNANQWQVFCQFRQDFKNQCEIWQSKFATELAPLQKNAALTDTPDYPIENPIVYNTALDKITQKDDIRLIVIGDNPGKAEQLSCNKQYLVGQSGKIAQSFFAKNIELGIDFRKNVIILNKTPVHTAKTNHLKYLIRNGSESLRNLIEESQIWMAQKTAELHQNLLQESECPLWLVGYAELKGKGLFIKYRDVLMDNYKDAKAWEKVFVYQHFSMNRFLIDLKNQLIKPTLNAEPTNVDTALRELGTFHRKEIFGK